MNPIETAPKDGTVIGVWSARDPGVIRLARWGHHLANPKQPQAWVTVTRSITLSHLPTHWIAVPDLPTTSAT